MLTPNMAFTYFFFLNDPAPTKIYPLPLHDALPICSRSPCAASMRAPRGADGHNARRYPPGKNPRAPQRCPQLGPFGPWQERSADIAVQALLNRSEEHTSELQSQSNLVCRLLLEKKQ